LPSSVLASFFSVCAEDWIVPERKSKTALVAEWHFSRRITNIDNSLWTALCALKLSTIGIKMKSNHQEGANRVFGPRKPACFFRSALQVVNLENANWKTAAKGHAQELQSIHLFLPINQWKLKPFQIAESTFSISFLHWPQPT
jgi:hypothetical protein